MKSKLKALGLVLAAAFALSALSASSALAVEDPGILNAEGTETATLSGEQIAEENGVLTLTDNGNLTTKCTSVVLTGTLGGAGTSTPTLHPALTGCTAFGLKSSVSTEGCNYTYHIATTIGATGAYDGTVGIECEAGKAITITAGTCALAIGAQNGLGTVEFTNMEGTGTPKKMDVTIHWNLRFLHYKVTKDGFLCPLTGEGKEFTEADYTGTTTLTAKVGNTPADLTVDMGAITP